jgi:hypothetical protein
LLIRYVSIGVAVAPVGYRRAVTPSRPVQDAGQSAPQCQWPRVKNRSNALNVASGVPAGALFW